jgi:hypothetical protein
MNVEKASVICCQNELATIGGYDGQSPEQISGQLESLNRTVKRESQRHDTRLLIHIIIGLHASSSSLSLSHTHSLFTHIE